jgi:hypothetical protein
MSYSIGNDTLAGKGRSYAVRYFLLIFFASCSFLSWLMSLGAAPFPQFLGCCLLVGTTAVSVTYNTKPSLFRLLPISYKQRISYYYASIVCHAMMVWAGSFVVFMLTLFPLALWCFIDGDDTLLVWFSIPYLFGGKVFLFCAFRELFAVSLLSIVARMKRLKSFLLSFALLIVVLFGGQIVLESLADVNIIGYVGRVNICLYLDTLPHPTIAVILCVVLGVVAFALSVLFTVYQEKPKKDIP